MSTNLMIAGRILRIVLTISSCSLTVDGHQDQILKISENKIMELPVKYSPALIDFNKNQLTIRDQKLNLPSFLSDVMSSRNFGDGKGGLIFEAGVKWRLSVGGSWGHDDHDKDKLPDYIVLKFQPDNKDYYFSIFVRLESPVIAGTQITLITYSKADGDKWVNSNKEISEFLSATRMELLVDDSIHLNWKKERDNGEGVEGGGK